jgi:hypothetical protein
VTDLITWECARLDEDEATLQELLAAVPGEWRVAEWIRQCLVDVAAKRRILNLHLASGSWPPGNPACITCGVIPGPWVPHPCPTVRLLALPHAGRPGYDESWLP